MPKNPHPCKTIAIFGRSYLVTQGLIFAATSVFVWQHEGTQADQWPWWGALLLASLLFAGVAQVLLGLFGRADHMEWWSEVLSRNEVALLVMALAFPVYFVLAPFYNRRKLKDKIRGRRE